MLKRKQQEEAYEEIMRVYDLTEGIIDALEHECAEQQEMMCSLVTPVVEQLGESTEEIAENYLDFINNEQKPSKNQVKKVEGAMRRVFNKATEFLGAIKELPSQVKGSTDIKSGTEFKIDPVHVGGPLPNVGYGPGELIPGGMWTSFEEQIKRLPIFDSVIRAVRAAASHIWRLVYFFHGMEHALVDNPQNIIWGRTVPDLKAQAIMEKHKAEMARQELLYSKTNSHAEMVNKSRVQRDGVHSH